MICFYCAVLEKENIVKGKGNILREPRDTTRGTNEKLSVNLFSASNSKVFFPSARLAFRLRRPLSFSILKHLLFRFRTECTDVFLARICSGLALKGLKWIEKMQHRNLVRN